MVVCVTEAAPSTPMVALYDELHARGVSRKAKLARAEAFVAAPDDLAARFGRSVAKIEGYLPLNQGFYTTRKRYAAGTVKAASTIDLALRIRDAGGLTIAHAVPTPGGPLPSSVQPVEFDRLACDYLDRELVATRTAGGAAPAGTAVRLDLLLANRGDRTPIVGEIKRTGEHDAKATDKDPFSALVQALACVSQLASPAQYARLTRWGAATPRDTVEEPGPCDIATDTPPLFDVYVLHNRPGGTYQAELATATERLAVALLATAPVARHVRRIACVITSLEGQGLHAEVDWAYERLAPTTARIESSFAEYFAPFAITLPAAACLPASDGSLYARGWSVRWRWRDAGILEFRASHRMTDERWHTIDPQGELYDKPVPPEMMILGPGDDRGAVEAAYATAWQAHAQATSESGMEFDESVPERAWADEHRAAWRLDSDIAWHFAALAPRPAS